MTLVLQRSERMNDSESAVFEALKCFPEDCALMCELRIRKFLNRTSELREGVPDFVFFWPQTGVVILEVKDWNLEGNVYEFQNQKIARKIPRDSNGRLHPDQEVILDNPWHQAWVYQNAMLELLTGIDVFVMSLVVFPFITRADFWNRLSRPMGGENPQERLMIDCESTLFRDDFESSVSTLQARLRQLAGRASQCRPAIPEVLLQAQERLILPELRIGEASRRRADECRQVRTLSEQQQRWAFQLPEGIHCLFDLAGSGKTNVLLSRAMHFVRTHRAKGESTKALVLTYSQKLASSLRHIMNDKLNGFEGEDYQGLHIFSVDELLIKIVAKHNNYTKLDLEDLLPEQPEARRQALTSEFFKIGPAIGDTFRVFDALYIDEFQDFTPLTAALRELLLRGNEFMMVGDIAQRIHQHQPSLHLLNIDLDRTRVKGHYLMYRCPAEVAAMAHSFILDDPLIANEMSLAGYAQIPRFKSVVQALPRFVRAGSRNDMFRKLADSIRQEACEVVPLREIMVVCAHESISDVQHSLGESGISTKREQDEEHAVLVVDFAESKGLEAEVVIICDMEQLPVSDGNGPFGDSSSSREIASQSRRLIYVAATRAFRRLIVHYYDLQHLLVKELKHHADRVGRRLSHGS